ncbi:alpha/beta fold hydrolase [Micromonospora sp. M12]
MAQLGDDLAAVLDAVAPTGPVVLVGHSMGGMTIMEYAHRHPRTSPPVRPDWSSSRPPPRAHAHRLRTFATDRPADPVGRDDRCRSVGAVRVLASTRALLKALQPSIRWMLFGDRCEPADIRLVTSAVARASLRSIGGFRASIGTQHRLDTLAALAHLPAAALVGDRDRLTHRRAPSRSPRLCRPPS